MLPSPCRRGAGGEVKYFIMNALINLIILYVIFTLISSAFSKRKQALQTQKTQRVKSPPPLPQRNQRPTLSDLKNQVTSFLQEEFDIKAQDVQIPRDVLTLSDEEIEPVEKILPEPMFSEPPRPTEQEDAPRRADVARKHPGILPQTRNRYLQGIILSEILGPPVSKRKRTIHEPPARVSTHDRG